MLFTFKKSFTSPASHIILIDFVPKDELQTSKSKYDEIRDEFNLSPSKYFSISDRVVHFRCETPDDFNAIVSTIHELIDSGATPVLFLDGHGSEDRGLQFPCGDFIDWKTYIEILGKITKKTKGELTVIAAFCYSLKLVHLINHMAPPPFSFYFGYKGKINAGTIKKEGRFIYKSLIKDGCTSLMNQKILNATLYSEYDHAEKISGLLIGIFSKDPSIHKQILKDFPQLSKGQLKTMLEQHFAKNGVRLSQSRKFIKEHLKANAALVSPILSGFMHDTPRRHQYEKDLKEFIIKL